MVIDSLTMFYYKYHSETKRMSKVMKYSHICSTYTDSGINSLRLMVRDIFT